MEIQSKAMRMLRGLKGAGISYKEFSQKTGITTYQIRKEKLLSESTVQKLRAGIGVSWENIETLCRLLDCQPADLMEYVKEN